MFGTVLIILIAGAVAILAAMRFIAAVRKLASREPDTRNTRTPSGHSHNYSELALRSQGNNTRNTRNTHASSERYGTRRQDKPPLVFWAVASPLLAAACLTVILLML